MIVLVHGSIDYIGIASTSIAIASTKYKYVCPSAYHSLLNAIVHYGSEQCKG